MPKKRFTMDDYYSQLEEVRQRVRLKSQPVAPTNLIERLRGAVLKRSQLPKLPKV